MKMSFARARHEGRKEKNEEEEHNGYVCRLCGRPMRYVGWNAKMDDDEWKCRCGASYFPTCTARARFSPDLLEGVTSLKKQNVFFGGDNG